MLRRRRQFRKALKTHSLFRKFQIYIISHCDNTIQSQNISAFFFKVIPNSICERKTQFWMLKCEGTSQYINIRLRHQGMKEDETTQNQDTQPQLKSLIEEVIVVGLNKHCRCRSDDQQLIWITSLQIVSYNQYEAEQLNNQHHNKLIKYRHIGNGLYLKIWFCQTNKKPIIKIKSSRVQSSNQSILLQYPGQRIQEQYIFYFVNDKQSQKRIIEDIEMIEVSTDNQLEMPQDNSYQIVRLPLACQNQQEQNSSNQQLVEKTRYLLVKTMDLEDQQHQLVQHFQPEVIFQYSMKKKSTHIEYKSFPHFCFPQGITLSNSIVGFGYSILNFILTQQDGSRIYVICLKVKQQLEEEIIQTLPANSIDKHIHNHEKLYTQKAICLVSKYCCTQFFHTLLQELFRKYQTLQNQLNRNLFSSHQMPQNIQIRQILNNFIREYEVGFKEYQKSYYDTQYMKDDLKMEMVWNGNKIIFPALCQSDHLNFSRQAIHCLFKMLSVDKIVQIVQSLLLQKSVIFVSQSQVAVGYAIESVVSFLYPLKWQNVILPMLPPCMLQLLQAPMPLIAGIPLSFATDQMIYKLKQQSLVVFLDLNDIIDRDETNETIHVNHFKEATKKLRIYDIYQKKHVEDMLKFKDQFYLFKVYLQEENHFSIQHIKHIFFQTMLLLLQNYHEYCRQNYQSPTKVKPQAKYISNSNEKKKPFHFKKDFMLQEFVKSHPKPNIKFMKKFAQSSHFVQFLYRSHEEKNPQKQLIDDALKRQKSRSSTENIFHERYSQKQNSSQLIGNLKKHASMPTSGHNITWSPPPKKSDIVTTNYSRNHKEKSLKLSDIEFQRQKSLNEDQKYQSKSVGKFVCDAINKAVMKMSTTKKNLILWTKARVARLKKEFLQKQKQQKMEQKEDMPQTNIGKAQNMVEKYKQMNKQPERKIK